MLRSKLLLGILFLIVLLSGCSIPAPVTGSSPTSTVLPPTLSSTTTVAGTSTPTVAGTSSLPITRALQSCATTTATNFYQAIQAHNLSKAYTYLDPTAHTQDGLKLTYDSFLQQVNEGGTTQHAFTFTIGGFVASSNEVVMTIDNGQMVYHSHLQVSQQGNVCRITTLDRV